MYHSDCSNCHALKFTTALVLKSHFTWAVIEHDNDTNAGHSWETWDFSDGQIWFKDSPSPFAKLS